MVAPATEGYGPPEGPVATKGRATTMATALSEPVEAARTLPMDPAMFGLLALLVFAVLLGATFAFRNVGNRH